MMSRNRSMSSAPAISIDRTTSANSTVTCLYSAVSPEAANGAPHSSQNLAFSRSSVPHDPHVRLAVMRPRSSPWPRRCVLRSQAIPPSRGSGPPSPGRRTSSPRARASSVRSRSSSDLAHRRTLDRPRRFANRSIVSWASARSPSAPRSSSVSTRTPVRPNAIPASRSAWCSSSTASRITGMAASRSPRPARLAGDPQLGDRDQRREHARAHISRNCTIRSSPR